MLKEQTPFFDRTDIDDLALRQNSSFVYCPGRVLVFYLLLYSEGNGLSSSSDRGLVTKSARSKVDSWFRQTGTCIYLLQKRHGFYVDVDLFQPLRNFRSHPLLIPAAEILREK